MKEKLLLFISLQFLSIICFSQVNTIDNDSSRIIFESYGKFGLKDIDGNIILTPKYESLQWSNNPANLNLGVIPYTKVGYMGLLDDQLKVLTPAKYKSLTPFSDSRIVASLKGKYSQTIFYGLIDLKGQVKLGFNYRKLIPAGDYLIAAAKENGVLQYGLIDQKADVVLPLKYYQIRHLGRKYLEITQAEGQTHILNVDNIQNPILENIDSATTYQSGLARVYKNGKVGALNSQGKLVLPLEYKSIKLNDGKVMEVTSFDTWYLFNHKFESVNSIKADSLKLLSYNKWISFCNGSSFLIEENESSFIKPLKGQFIDTWQQYLLVQAKEHIYIWDTTDMSSKKIDGNYIDSNNQFLICRAKDFYGSNYTIYNSSGETVEGTGFELVNDSILYVQKKGYWGVYNSSLEEITPTIYDQIFIGAAPNEYIVKFQGLYGVIDGSQSWEIGPEMIQLEVLDSDIYWAVNKYLQEFIISDTSRSEADLHYYQEKGHLFEGNISNEIRLVNIQGIALSSYAKGRMYDVNDKGYLIKQDTQYRCFNFSGEELFRVSTYDSIGFIEDDYMPVYKDGNYGFIDYNGKLRIANRYTGVKNFQEGLAAVQLNGKWGFVNKNEDLVIQPYYKSASSFKNELAIVQQNEGYGIINQQGNTIIESSYDSLIIDEHYIFLKKGSKWGYASLTGSIIRYPDFNSISYNHGLLLVEKYGEFYLIDNNGNQLLPDKYKSISYLDENDFILTSDKGGKKLIFLSDLNKGQLP